MEQEIRYRFVATSETVSIPDPRHGPEVGPVSVALITPFDTVPVPSRVYIQAVKPFLSERLIADPFTVPRTFGMSGLIFAENPHPFCRSSQFVM
jgi:hypothetical protein